jgi:hypothetical protein
MVKKQNQCTDQSAYAPYHTEDNPPGAVRASDRLDIAKIESLVPFDQDELLD